MPLIRRASYNVGRGPKLKQLREGFVVNQSKDIYLFEEGTGSSVASIADSPVTGTLEVGPGASAAYTWLSGGGVELQRTAQIKAQAIDFTAAWTIWAAGAILVPITYSGGLAFTPVFGHEWSPTIRGIQFYTSFSSPDTDPEPFNLSVRPANNGAAGTTDTIPEVVRTSERRVFSVRHDGNGRLTTSIHKGDGTQLITRDTLIDEAQATTISGNQVTNLRPVLGTSWNQSIMLGRTRWEAFGTATRRFDQVDMAHICAAALALGVARSRPFT